MSRFRHSAIGLGVGLDRIASAVCTSDSGDWRVQSASLPEALSSEHMTHVLDSLLEEHEGAKPRIHVVFAPDSLREWVMEVPVGVQSLGELRSLTMARFTQLYGLSPDAWTVTADWRTRGPMLCTAVPTALMDTLRADIERRGLRSSISTTLCSALGDIPALPDEAWLCIRTHGCLSLLQIRRRALQLLRTLRSADADLNRQLSTVVAEMKRACLRSGFAPAPRIHWYDCSQPRIGQTMADGVEIVPLSSPALQRMASAPKDADCTVAACMGAAL